MNYCNTKSEWMECWDECDNCPYPDDDEPTLLTVKVWTYVDIDISVYDSENVDKRRLAAKYARQIVEHQAEDFNWQVEVMED